MELITLSPINIYFCNVNKALNLPGHCHYATVTISMRTIGGLGFPIFQETAAEIRHFLQHELKLTGLPMTNEEVGRYIIENLRTFHFSATKQDKYAGCDFALERLKLSVMGVNDAIDHADGFGVYEFTDLGEAAC